MHDEPKPLNVASLKRTEFVRLLNQTFTAEKRRNRGRRDSVTTVSTVANWIAAGMPTNPNGTINLAEACAWLAIQRKESRGANVDRKTKAEKEFSNLDADLKRSQIEANDANTQFRKVRTELEEFKRRLQSGELIEARDVERREMEIAYWLGDTLGDFRRYANRLFNLPLEKLIEELDRIGGELRTSAAAESREIVERESVVKNEKLVNKNT